MSVYEMGLCKGRINWFGIMTDEELKAMSKDDANRLLNVLNKRRWVDLHNETANLYFIKDCKIVDVEPSGWWY